MSKLSFGTNFVKAEIFLISQFLKDFSPKNKF